MYSSQPTSLGSVAPSGPTHSSHGSSSSTSSIWDSLFVGDEFEEKEDEFDSGPNKDALVFLVDCSRSMFQEMSSGEVPFKIAMRCIYQAVSGKIISSPQDDLAVVFYGCGKQKGDFPGVYVLQSFDKPSAALLEQLDHLGNHYDMGHFDDFPLCDAFWTCSALLGRVKCDQRRVWLFTDEDSPHRNDEQQLARARARLEDYRMSGVEVELFGFDRKDHAFSLAPFYHNIGVDEDEPGLWKACNRMEDMMNVVRRKVVKKRSQATLSFQVAEGLEIAVKLYTMLREADKSTHVWLEPVHMHPVKPVTKWICGDTGMILRPAQMKKYLPYGEAKVVFESDEVKKLKFLYPPGIVLLGFKDRAKLKDYHNLSHANFIFPDESSVKGSVTAFASLLHSCVLKEKIAIVRYVPRTNAIPQLAALVPQVEQWADDRQVQPSGFHVILLPFADDLRNLEVAQNWDAATPTAEQVLKARQVVQTLQVNYDPFAFNNPQLQMFFATLQKLALGKSDPLMEFEDNIFPDEEGLAHFSSIIKEWKGAVVPDDYEADAPKGKVKREKRPAAEGEGYDGDWNVLVQSDANQKQVTIPQLKVKLRELGLPVSGNKSVLWDRVKDSILSNSNNNNNINNNNNNSRNVRIKLETNDDEEEF